MRYTETVIKSLHPDIGDKIEHWRITPNDEGKHISGVVDHELAFLGANVGEQYEDLFSSKSAELRDIQDNVFAELNA